MPGRSKAGTKSSVLMGRIGAAHGISGEVRLQSFTDTPLDIASYGPFLTDKPGLVIEIASARPGKNVIIARLKGVTDRNAAEQLNGVELYVDRADLPVPEDEDDFYYTDLIGLEVRLEDGTVYGTISNIADFGAGDVLEIARRDQASELIAFTRANVPEVNIEKGYVVLSPPEEIIVRDGE